MNTNTVTVPLSAFGSQAAFNHIARLANENGVTRHTVTTRGFFGNKQAVKFSAEASNRSGSALVVNLAQQLGLV